MLALKVIGKLDDAGAFHMPYDGRLLLKNDLAKSSRVWYDDILVEARSNNECNNRENIRYLEMLLGYRFSLYRFLVRIKKCVIKIQFS